MFVRNASPRGPMCFRCLIFSMKVVIFTLFYYLLDLSCGECNVISFYMLCCSVNEYVCCVSDSVCELLGETIRNRFGCGCYFVV